MGFLDYIKETIRLNREFYKNEAADVKSAEYEDSDGQTHATDVSALNAEYLKMRKQQMDWLERHYDLNTAAGIKAIPEIKNPPRSPVGGPMDVTGDIDYYLRFKATEHEKDGRVDLAILCLKKSNAIRKLKYPMYNKDAFYSLVRLLARSGYKEEAYKEKSEIDAFFAGADASYKHVTVRRILNEAKEMDTDLLLMNPHGMSCPLCAKYQGRVFSISGRNKLFPKLPREFFEFGGMHDECGHSFTPYIYGISRADLDYTLQFQTAVDRRYTKDIVAFSNRPFIDDRAQEDINRALEYIEQRSQEREQIARRQATMIEREYHRGEEARIYEWLQQNLPDICPKSISSFRRMKNQNTKNYQRLAEEARKLGREI